VKEKMAGARTQLANQSRNINIILFTLHKWRTA
jgi:hypothetical protein